MSIYKFDIDETKKKVSQKIIKVSKTNSMEIDISKGQKRSLFVDLPKEIELKISDSTIEQQVLISYF